MRILRNSFLAIIAISFSMQVSGQDDKKVSFTGASRGQFYGDRLEQDAPVADSVTVPRLNNGHVLVDLGVNIRPNKNTEILGMVRVRNDYGGFWGSGVTFDVRQLYVKGVIGGIVRYQLGDINYRMTKYTLWNSNQEVISSLPAIFQQQTDVINYDHFYADDHSWRQQGASAGFALVFKKFIQELQVNAVTTRVRTSDNSTVNDRLFSGVNFQLVQSKFVQAGFNYTNLYDVSQTSKNPSIFRNPVATGTLLANYDYKKWAIGLDAEFGKSKTFYENNTEAPEWEGKFLDATVSLAQTSWGIKLGAQTKYVGSAFRSPGAQTKRIDFNQLPVAYARITNDQELRPLTMLDLMRESSFYNLQLRPYLMSFSPGYDNITPYGDATPNRQGMVMHLNYNKQNSPVEASYAYSALQEVRGEGTLLPRKFTRNQIVISSHVNKFIPNFKKDIHVSLSLRNDQTSRPGEDLVQAVDLKTNALSAGLEVEVVNGLDLLFGFQDITYKGFDYTSVRNTYSEIFNFNEYVTDGQETMLAYGARYRFSERSFLSAQVNRFQVKNALSTLSNYSINQFMLLFQMKF